VLAALAAACVDFVDLKNIHYNINMLNDSHQKTASWVNLCPGAGIQQWPQRLLVMIWGHHAKKPCLRGCG
jgi:hypothetical protein